MKNLQKTLQVLKDELLFVQKGSYHAPIAWRAPLVFEDSPRCPKEPDYACPDVECVLMRFVPKECCHEIAPCRHIPLNDLGETADSLYRTGTNEEIEQTLRRWLERTIQQLEETSERPCLQQAA
jgi:hypothetical protein